MQQHEPAQRDWSTRDTLGVIGAGGAALLVLSTCVSTEFQKDDYLHLYELVTLDASRFLLEMYCGHVLITFHAVVAALHALFGLHAIAYYIVGLATHTVNVALLYAIVRRYAHPSIATVTAGLWGIVPVHYSVLSWFSVYAHVLTTTSLLFALTLLTRFFVRRREPPRWALGACVVLIALGAASYGMGVAVAFVFPAVAWLLAPPESRPARVVRWCSPLLVVPVAYLLVSRFTDPLCGMGSPAAAARLFLRFLAYGPATLILGPFFTVKSGGIAGWPVASLPVATITQLAVPVTMAVAVLLALVCFRADRGTWRGIAAGGLLGAAAYGSVALRQVPWIVPLDSVVTTPRYHYLPLAAAALTLGLAAAVLDRGMVDDTRRRRAGLAVGLYALAVVIGSFQVVRRMPKPVLVAAQASAATARDRLARTIYAAAPGATVFIQNEQFIPVKLVMFVAGKSVRFPGLAAYFAILYDENTVAGRHVRFVELDADLVQQVRDGPSPRMRELLVTEDEARAERMAPQERL